MLSRSGDNCDLDLPWVKVRFPLQRDVIAERRLRREERGRLVLLLRLPLWLGLLGLPSGCGLRLLCSFAVGLVLQRRRGDAAVGLRSDGDAFGRCRLRLRGLPALCLAGSGLPGSVAGAGAGTTAAVAGATGGVLS